MGFSSLILSPENVSLDDFTRDINATVPNFNAFFLFMLIVISYTFGHMLYNLYFHPLSSFPGPKLAAMSNIYAGYVLTSGRQPEIIRAWHEKYGDAIRIAPNDVSFSTKKSLEDIYEKNPGRKFFPKNKFFDGANMGFEEYGIISEQNVNEARRKRHYLLPFFTLRTLRKYSEVMDKYIFKFLHHVEIQGSSPRGVDIKELLNWTTFDIIGDLTFGESFGCLDHSRSHKWQSILNDNVNIATFADALRRFPLLSWFVSRMLPKRMRDAQMFHKKFTLDKIQNRLDSPRDPQRVDFMTHLIDLTKKGRVHLQETAANIAQIITAGAESPGTAMVFTMWYLLKTPHIMKKVCKELREEFSSVQDITGDSTVYLPYLNASIKEAFRMQAVGPTGLPRTSPGETVDGYYVPANTVVFSHTWSIFRSKVYWSDPDTFKPERWVDPNNTRDNKEALVVFGIGPRRCPAQESVPTSKNYRRLITEINSMSWTIVRVILGRLFYLMDVTLENPEHDWMSGVKAYLLWSCPPLMVRTERRAGTEHEKW